MQGSDDRNSWATGRLWDSARDAFMTDWRSLSPESRGRFLRVLAVGLASVLALTAVIALVARTNLGGREAELEASLVEASADWRWPSFHKSIWLEEPGGSTLLIPVVLLATWTAARLGRSLEAIAIAAAFVGAKPILLLGRLLFRRDRPDLIADGIVAPGTESFPSGHTIQAVCVWGVLAYLLIRSSGSWLERAIVVVLWLAISAVVAAARLRLGTHWPSDLAAGAVLGIAWAGVIVFAVRSSAPSRSPDAVSG